MHQVSTLLTLTLQGVSVSCHELSQTLCFRIAQASTSQQASRQRKPVHHEDCSFCNVNDLAADFENAKAESNLLASWCERCLAQVLVSYARIMQQARPNNLPASPTGSLRHCLNAVPKCTFILSLHVLAAQEDQRSGAKSAEEGQALQL